MKKRLALSILFLAATTLLVGAVTYALFQGTASNLQNTYTIGTVSLEAPVQTAFNITGLSPGCQVQAGSFQITYSGTLEAWLGLDIVTAGDIFIGDTPCLPAVTVLGPEMKEPAEYGSGTDQAIARAVTEDIFTFSIFCYMPWSAGEEYTGKSGTLTVLVKAVQANNNTNQNNSGPLAWE